MLKNALTYAVAQGFCWSALIPDVVAWSCSTCSVDPASRVARSAFWGVITLGGVLLAVFGAIGWVGYTMYKRAKLVEALELRGEAHHV